MNNVTCSKSRLDSVALKLNSKGYEFLDAAELSVLNAYDAGTLSVVSDDAIINGANAGPFFQMDTPSASKTLTKPTEDLSLLTDDQLQARIGDAVRDLDWAYSAVAEVESERAHFGDSAPGSAKVFEWVPAAKAALRPLEAEWTRRHPPVPAALAPLGSDDCPF